MRVADWLWTKTPIEWRWMKVSTTFAVIGMSAILIADGETSAIGWIGLIGMGAFVLTTLLAIVLRPVAEPSRK